MWLYVLERPHPEFKALQPLVHLTLICQILTTPAFPPPASFQGLPTPSTHHLGPAAWNPFSRNLTQLRKPDQVHSSRAFQLGLLLGFVWPFLALFSST